MSANALVEQLAKLALMGLAGVSLSSVGARGMLAQAATSPTVLDEKSLIPVGVFIAGAGLLAAVIWRTAAYVTRSDARSDALRERIEELCDRVSDLEDRQDR